MSTNDDKPFEQGEVIKWCDEEYVVLDNYGTSGTVKAEGGEQVGSFHWNCYGETAHRKVS